MIREEPPALEPARGLSPLGITILAALLAFLGGIAATVALVQLRGGWSDTPAVQEASAPTAQPTVPTLPPGTDLATLNAREAVLAARLDQIDARVDTASSESRMAESYATRAEALLIASASRRQLDRGQPLGTLESQLRRRFGETHPEAVAAILRASEEPVTVEDLRLALDAIAPRLAAGGPDESWWTRARRLADDLVVLRRETSPSPRPSDRLKRARRLLDAGQVEAALAEVAHMPGVENAQSWITAARRHIAARSALNDIELAAIGAHRSAPAAAALRTIEDDEEA